MGLDFKLKLQQLMHFHNPPENTTALIFLQGLVVEKNECAKI
jgi:hypothetical protein